jgi:RNA polymerase sigma-70 factor, ECF subfamily
VSPHSVQSDVKSPGVASPVVEIYERSKAAAFGIPAEAFETILREVARKYLPPNCPDTEIYKFWATLRLEELALARACAAGHERAWEIFLTRYREKLYDIAGYVARESSAARELADSLYADLYGTTQREGERISKLASYTGRGSLEGWLRTVLAQEYVNRYRRQRRLVSLDEQVEAGEQFPAAAATPTLATDTRLEAAVDEALGELAAEDRFVLASYFLDERTLAEIARILRVHESTISRKVDKLAKALRKRILATLKRQGMSHQQAQDALEVDVRDLRVNIRDRLVQETATGSFSEQNAKAPAGEPSG